MRKVTLIATALIAALALSAGALAYPAVVGTHPLATAHASTPATVTHPKTGDDNSTGNETNDNETGDHQGVPSGNETENETENETGMSDVSVEHNVTVTRSDNTTWVNGTIIVVKGNTTLADITFAIVVHDGGMANVTFNGTQIVGSTVISIKGVAVYSTEHRAVEIFGVATATSSGTVQWVRMFAFEAPSEFSGCP